jgi:8-oxo-dGTP diphosphatase
MRHATASAVVLSPNRESVLLVFHNASQCYMFPGGHVDPNETPAEAAEREVWEETGLRITLLPVRFTSLPGMTVLPNPWMTLEIPAPAKKERRNKPAEPAHSHIDHLFLATADSSKPLKSAPDEVSDVIWAPISRLHLFKVRAEVPRVAAMAVEALS